MGPFFFWSTLMIEINELKGELKEVVREMRAGHMTQMEILVELRGLKPRVEKLEEEQEKLKIFMYKALGILSVVSMLGLPTTVYFLSQIGGK